MDPRGFPTSLPEFQRIFPNDAACATYLEKLRWPDEFMCGKCGTLEAPYRFANRPQVLRCRSCKADNSLTAGTVMQGTHTPLSVWFWAAYLVATEPSITATQLLASLPEHITRYETAWQLRRVLRSAGRRDWRGLHAALGVERASKRGPKPVDVATRFIRLVQRDGPVPKHRPELGECHLWTGARDPNGYGRFNIHGRAQLAHRVGFYLARGRWPKLCALHACDNPSCVRPEHLFEGTRPENTADMVRKNRSTPRVLSPAQVADVLASTRRGERGYAIAKRLGVSASLISLTLRRRS